LKLNIFKKNKSGWNWNKTSLLIFLQKPTHVKVIDVRSSLGHIIDQDIDDFVSEDFALPVNVILADSINMQRIPQNGNI
jgi:hypothetical protein